MQVMEAIGKTGMVPVFYHSDAEIAKQVVKACYEGGVRAFEFKVVHVAVIHDVLHEAFKFGF